jgi:tetratricopeptide (TPR) repeat protein
MGQRQGSGGGQAATMERRHELLSRLGLGDDAGDQDIEGAYREVLDFLDGAPSDLSAWAAARRDDVDRAFALLCGPDEAFADDEAVEEDPQPAPRPRSARPAQAAAVETPGRQRRGALVWLVSAVAVVAVVFGVYQMGQGSSVPGISGTPTSTATSAGIDQAQVAALMQKISADPKDVTSLQALGDQYFQAGDYETAVSWETKVLAIDPKNQTALLAIGAAQFNLGNADAAEKQWLVAEKLYPNNAEVHYDLGFLYMSKSPSDTVKMRAQWQKVIDIDPKSDLAKTVSTHLSQASASPTASSK